MAEKTEETTFERNLKIIDALFKGLSTLVVIVGIIITISQFLDVKRQESASRQKELNTLLYKTRLDLYIEATNTTAKFSQAKTKEEAETAGKDFWVLYYGKLSLVEDENVKIAMVTYGNSIRDWEEDTQPPNDFIAPAKYNYREKGKWFPDLSYSLSQYCRDHLSKTFADELPVLSSGKP